MDTPSLYTTSPEIADFIQRLPKAETHIILEGSVSWDLMKKAFPQKYTTPPASWGHEFRYSTYSAFERDLLEVSESFFTGPERYYEAAKQLFKEKKAQNVQYIELSIDAQNLKRQNLCGRDVTAAILAAAPADFLIRIFLNVELFGDATCLSELLQQSLSWEHLSGYSFAGSDLRLQVDWAKQFMEQARDLGKFIKAVAGELDGPDSILDVAEAFAITRIIHGISAYEDSEIVRLLCENEIALDMCPITNVKLKVIRSMAEHSIRPLFDQGVTCMVSTGYSFLLGNSLLDEYAALVQDLDFTCNELAELSRSTFHEALIDDKVKNKIMREIDSMKTYKDV